MAEQGGRLPRRYAAVVGVDDYLPPIATLRSAVSDARAMSEILRRHGYEPPIERLDGAATLEGLEELLTETLPALVGRRAGARPQSDAGLLLYFAGHGTAVSDDTGPEGFLLPQDATLGAREGWLSMRRLRQALELLDCRHLLVVLDCCYAGRFRWATPTRGSDLGEGFWLYDSQYDHYLAGRAWQVLTSAAHDQLAADLTTNRRDPDDRPDHSPFAAALLAGLAGLADWSNEEHGADGVILAPELYLYIRQRLWSEGLRQTPGLWPLAAETTGEYLFLAPDGEKNTRPDPLLDEANNPWPSTDPYELSWAPLFFGRRRLVEALLDRLLAIARPNPPHGPPPRRLLAVVGPSGSGKTSLVEAGLIPLLRRPSPELGERGGRWHVVTLVDHPEGVSAALAEAEERLAEAPPDHHRLLVIDAFEAFALSGPTGAAENGWLERLRQLTDPHQGPGPPAPPVVLITLGSRHEPRTLPLLGEPAPGRFEVSPTDLKMGELRQAIVGPADARALFFEPAWLVGRLVGEVWKEPGGLALVSATLSRVYGAARLRRLRSAKPDRALTVEDYRAVGELAGVVHELADTVEAWARDEGLGEVLRRILLRLVSLAGSRPAPRRAEYRELDFPDPGDRDHPDRDDPHDGGKQQVERVLARLAEARLVVADRDGVEPAHPELVRSWPGLERWLGLEGRSQVVLRREVWGAAVGWQDDGRPEGRLWVGDPRLPRLVERRGELNRLELAFVGASLRRTTGMADRERVAQARDVLQRDPTLAALVLRRLVDADTTPYAVATLLETLARPLAHRIVRGEAGRRLVEQWHGPSGATNRQGTRLEITGRDSVRVLSADPGRAPAELLGHRAKVYRAFFDATGREVLTTSADDTVRLWRLGDPAGWEPPIPRRLGGEPGTVVGGGFAASGRRVLTVSMVGAVLIWDLDGESPSRPITLDNSDEIFVLPGLGGRIPTALLDATGNRVLTVTPLGTTRLWRLGPGSVGAVGEPRVLPGIGTAFDPTGRWVSTVDYSPPEGGIVRLWSVDGSASNPPRALTVHRDRITTARFVTATVAAPGADIDPGALGLLTASLDGSAKLWRLSTDGVPGEPVVLDHGGPVASAMASADGGRVLGVAAGSAWLWWIDPGTGRPIEDPLVFGGTDAPVKRASLDPTGTRVITHHADRGSRVWQPGSAGSTGEPRSLEHSHSPAVFDRRGGRLLTASEVDGTARVWRADGGGEPLVLRHHDRGSGSVWAVFDSGGERVLTASGSGVAVWTIDGRLLQEALGIATSGVDPGMIEGLVDS